MNRSRGALLMAALAFASTQPSPAQDMAIKPKTAAEAKAFTEKVEKELLQLANAASRANWVKSTHITDDTEAIAAEANQHYTEAAVAAAKRAARRWLIFFIPKRSFGAGVVPNPGDRVNARIVRFVAGGPFDPGLFGVTCKFGANSTHPSDPSCG